MQKSVYFAKSLLILSYSLLYVLLESVFSIRVWEPLFHGLIFIAYIVFITMSYEALYSAFLQAMGSSRVDSALRRIGGVAELIDNLHEYTELEALLRYTQSSLTALLGGSGAKLLVAAEKCESEESENPDFLQWGTKAQQALKADSAAVRFAYSAQQGFKISDCPPEAVKELEQFEASVVIPVLRQGKILAFLLLKDPAGVVAELQTLLVFFARQFGIALERIIVEKQKRLRQDQVFAEKSAALSMLSATIAHEMRTPLSGVRASIGGVDAFLPDLITAYQDAHAKNPERFPLIRQELLDTLRDTGPRIKSMVDQANHVIDLLLVNLNDQQQDRSQFKVCSIQACVAEALEQYPFRRFERDRVHVEIEEDFEFLGIQSLMVYIFFNLLKNALYSIESAGRGRINIKALKQKDGFTLEFADTGLGIEAEILPFIFDGFFTTRSNGTGAGLAFCKRTMRSFNGDITVSSVPGEYTRFTLVFPPVFSAETSLPK
jgi:signal transduction histidine kinase